MSTDYIIGLVITSLIGVLQMWMMLNQYKIKDEMNKKFSALEEKLTLKIEDIKEKIPSKEQGKYMRREIKMMFINIATQLGLQTKAFELDRDDE